MKVSELEKHFQNRIILEKAKKAFENILKNEPRVVQELNIKNKDEITFRHKETSLVIYAENGYGKTVVKYVFKLITADISGFYTYIIDLNKQFLDDFLVID